MQNSGSPHLDLSGKLIIKVALGEDIRRIPIHNEDITYDELVLMMQRVYRGKLSTNDEITIKYKDEDGDLITIFDSSDLTFAIQCSRILKITLFVGGPSKSILEPSQASSIRRELQEVRDKVIGLLDRLEPTALVVATHALSLVDGIAGDSLRKSTPVGQSISRPVNAVGGKEFDPLSAQKSVEDAQSKVASSFGIDGNVATASSYERAATPDSVSSIGSSASNQVRAQQNAYQPQQQQQQPSPQPLASQHHQQLPYPNQQGYNQGQQGQMPQAYAGQPGYGGIQAPEQQVSVPQQVPVPQQQHQQHYDPSVYNQYNQGYSAPVSQQGQGQPPQVQGQILYGQPSAPNPYGQAPGMPQQPQVGTDFS
uniref:PB1 domain-containing protein n=1 Tax=Arion vulgaris TaxID=1028688 RepID=A0A0B7A3T8_9EUPU